MRHLNTAPHALDFTLRGKRYEVPVGGEVEIPDRLAFAVKGRGLPLAPVEGEASGEERVERDADEKPTDPTALLWYTRAHDVRTELYAAQARAADVARELGDARSFLGLASSIPLAAGLESMRANVDEMTAYVRERDEAHDQAVRERDGALAAVVAANEEIARLNAAVEEQKGALAKANGRLGALTAAASKAKAGEG